MPAACRRARWSPRPPLAILAALLAALWATGAGAEIFVSGGQYGGAVGVLATGASGSASLGAIQGPKSHVGAPVGTAADPVHGELYVADGAAGLVVVPLDARSDVAAKRVAAVGAGDDIPFGIAYDPVHEEIYILTYQQVTAISRVFVYPRTVSGAAKALRTLDGPATGFGLLATAIAYDTVRGELYVIGPSSVLVFARTANGNAAPVRTIPVTEPFGLSLDPGARELLVTTMAGDLLTFDIAADGRATEKRRMTRVGASSTQIAPLGGTELVVGHQSGTYDGTDDRLLVLPRTFVGAGVQPLRTITGPATAFALGITVANPPLFLAGGRFQVEAVWKTKPGEVGSAMPVPLTDTTGFFWFFSAQNVEAVVKIVDGCGLNQKFWFFAGGLTDVLASLRVTDRVTGAVRIYENPQGTPFQPIQDTSAFACGSSPQQAPSVADAAAVTARQAEAFAAEIAASAAIMASEAPTATACTGLCLAASRFKVTAMWQTRDRKSGTAIGVPVTSDTGYLWFFDAANVEAVVKIVDGCGLNHRYWFFAGGLSNVRIDITVEDTVTGVKKIYTNPLNKAFQPIQDTNAFASCG